MATNYFLNKKGSNFSSKDISDIKRTSLELETKHSRFISSASHKLEMHAIIVHDTKDISH
jgi:hypothetical protein